MYLSMIDLQGETEASSISGINDNPTLCMQSFIKGSLAEKLPIYERHPSQVKVKKSQVE